MVKRKYNRLKSKTSPALYIPVIVIVLGITDYSVKFIRHLKPYLMVSSCYKLHPNKGFIPSHLNNLIIKFSSFSFLCPLIYNSRYIFHLIMQEVTYLILGNSYLRFYLIRIKAYYRHIYFSKLILAYLL